MQDAVSAVAPGLLRVWWQAVRPKSFTATTTPVLAGIALAFFYRQFDLFWAVITLVAAILLQAGTNLVNDFYDYRNQVDSSASLSPSGVIQQGLLSPRAVILGGMICFALGVLIGVALAVHTGPVLWAIGSLGVLIGIFYTAGPFPLAYIGLGEVAVFIAMGPAMVLGAYIAQTQRVSWEAIIAGIPIGLLVAAILHANNLRDIDTDRAQGKMTLAARFGRRFARREYTFLLDGAYIGLILPGLLDHWLWPAALPALLTLPSALRLIREANATELPSRLNGVLRGTAALHGRFGLLWVAGIVVVALVRILLEQRV